jgi:hypothetical protein
MLSTGHIQLKVPHRRNSIKAAIKQTHQSALTTLYCRRQGTMLLLLLLPQSQTASYEPLCAS